MDAPRFGIASRNEVADLEFASQARHNIGAPGCETALRNVVIAEGTHERELGLCSGQRIKVAYHMFVSLFFSFASSLPRRVCHPLTPQPKKVKKVTWVKAVTWVQDFTEKIDCRIPHLSDSYM